MVARRTIPRVPVGGEAAAIGGTPASDVQYQLRGDQVRAHRNARRVEAKESYVEIVGSAGEGASGLAKLVNGVMTTIRRRVRGT